MLEQDTKSRVWAFDLKLETKHELPRSGSYELKHKKGLKFQNRLFMGLK
ncbi:hypothetical protein MtrunA17_Chr1g0173261 [Medicago truncatula]|uniref:Uncharacterized protein n=1 Tax=Medicago truncatula TaxID=3880 RepID=A0A396JLE0_MEDTR|nr:hypothetical protein MtrunA17_Chr1g0173261 [Medicago truncatula]